MQIEDYFNVLSTDDIRIKGSRIGIETVLYEYIYRARTPEEITQQFETITLEQVYATILYYLHNKEIIIASASFPKEYQDRIEYLPLSK